MLGVLAIIVGACGGATQPTPTTAATAAATTAPTTAPTAAAKPGELDADTIAKAKQEGALVLYSSLSEDDGRYIVGKFGEAFPQIKVEFNRKSSDKIVAQFITEAKAGKVLGDVLESGGLDVAKAIKEGLTAEFRPPAAEGFPATYKDAKGMWTAARLGIETIAWNTKLVQAADAPKSFEDLTDPKWKGKILLESSDVEVMLGLAILKFKDDAKARDHFAKLKANQPQLSAGHTETTDLLIAGQRATFWGAHAHTTLSKMGSGAPLDYMRTEGVVTIDGPVLAKGAAHPNAAKVFINWYLSEDGQKAIAARNRVPARPGVADPKLMPQTQYVTGPNYIDEFAKYQKMWNEIFEVK